MLSDYFTYAASALGAVAVLVAVGLVRATRPVPLRRRVAALRGWHVADRVRLDDRSVDHVIVSPAALLAVTSAPESPTPAQVHAAERAAQQVRELAGRTGVADAVVVPVIHVSGAGTGHRVVAGVHVVDDPSVQEWLRTFRETTLAPAARIALARALDLRAEAPRRSRRAGALLAAPEPAGA